MSKRDEAFELFNQGKVPTDSEVVALGVKAESAKRYYRQWKQLSQEVTPTPPEGKAFLSSLGSRAKFEHNGKVYMRDSILNGGNIAGIEIKTQRRLVFRPNTLVTPK